MTTSATTDVTLTERDMLALEWELHHVRWMANAIRDLVARAMWLRVEDYSRFPEEATRDIPSSRSEMLIKRDRWIAGTPKELQDEIDKHAAERQWWADNKLTAPINQLRLAVRQEMMRASGAQGEFDPTPQPGDPPEQEETRSSRWLMGVRASIAERRMRAGKFKLLFEEALQHDPEWGLTRLKELDAEYHPMETYDRLNGMSESELAAYVTRSEKAAANFGVTGNHLKPGWIDP